MRCSECQHFVTDINLGCLDCKLSNMTKLELKTLDHISDTLRILAKTTDNWADYRLVIETMAKFRQDIYNEAIEELKN